MPMLTVFQSETFLDNAKGLDGLAGGYRNKEIPKTRQSTKT